MRQRIQRLFRTRKGELVLRRTYGSNLPDLVDKKTGPGFRLDVYAQTAEALANPANEINDEFVLHRVQMNADQETGSIALALLGEYLVHGQVVTIEGIKL